MELVFATNNKHKLKEISNLVGKSFKILSLTDIDCNEELEETHDTLEENAFEKSAYIFNKYGMNCFADDTGLEIDALEGRPGVYSARYAGNNKSFDDNMNKVLFELKGEKNRKAKFRTVISLVIDGNEYVFEGSVDGVITDNFNGINGFGYDPIFVPDGFTKTFAEMTLEEKNSISHRGRAIAKLTQFLLSMPV